MCLPIERGKAEAMSSTIRLAAITFFALVFAATSALAQASGYVRVKIVKAGVIVGAGGGSGVLTYRGRDYPFRVSGLSMGLTAGASVSRLEGRASGIRQVSDFAGTYSAVGAGGAFVGGLGGVYLRNEKGVTIALQGLKAGMEFAANLSGIRISLR
jgi:lipid-binding SYLF domain-containing protein